MSNEKGWLYLCGIGYLASVYGCQRVLGNSLSTFLETISSTAYQNSKLKYVCLCTCSSNIVYLYINYTKETKLKNMKEKK